MRRVAIWLLLSLAGSGTTPAGVTYDETIDGALSNDGLTPTPVQVFPGRNTITGTVGGTAPGDDSDFFTVALPPGWSLDAVTLDAYSGVTGATFLGMEDDDIFVTGQGNLNYFGALLFEPGDIGADLLPALGASNGFFAPPLPAGAYAFWVNEAGAAESYTLSLHIRLPGDLNCDGLVNAGDIDPFIDALTDVAGYAQLYPDCDRFHADVNRDGVVTAGDIDPFVGLLVGG